MTLFKYIFLAFCCGVMFGVGFTSMIMYSETFEIGSFFGTFGVAHAIIKKDSNLPETIVRTASDFKGTNQSSPTTTPKWPDSSDRDDNVTAVQLYEKVRVLCWIMTSPVTLKKKAIHVRDTWSRRCNIRLFMSSIEDKDFPAIGLPVKEGRDQLYEKTKAAYKYAWEHYRDKADWFMKADDDTYVILENLRFLLKDYDPNKPIYFGRRFKPYVKQGYMSGGAGYVLSNEALNRFVEGINSQKCRKGGGVEDVEMGKCMNDLGVESGDSRDSQGRETFHPLGPKHHLIEGAIPKDFWLWKYNFYPTCSGVNCSSDYPVTFHYVSSNEMHIFDYMIYNVQVYGLSHLYRKYPKLPYEN